MDGLSSRHTSKLNFEEFEDGTTDIPEFREALNEATSDGQRNRQILQLFYADLPKCQNAGKHRKPSFRSEIVEPEMTVSKD